jgi:hypothetical protein
MLQNDSPSKRNGALLFSRVPRLSPNIASADTMASPQSKLAKNWFLAFLGLSYLICKLGKITGLVSKGCLRS